MSVAARAKARAEEAARIKAETAAKATADALKKARPAKAKPVARAAPPSVPTPVSGRSTPAARRRAFLIASSAGRILAASGVAGEETASNDDLILSPDVQRIVFQLQSDQKQLKTIKATERKVEAKAAMLPAYRGWCDGVLAAGAAERGPLDQIFTTIMAWTIDVGDYMTALPMLEHAVKHKLEMPGDFERDPITFAIDQICDDAILAYEIGGEAAGRFDAAVLPMLEDLVDEYDIDLHDEVEAKLHKAIGRAVMAGADPEKADDFRQRQATTLKAYLRALELDPRVGVKKDVEKLQRELKKAAASDGADADVPPPGDDAAASDTPPPADG